MKYFMNVSMNSSASPAKLLALAVSEWLQAQPHIRRTGLVGFCSGANEALLTAWHYGRPADATRAHGERQLLGEGATDGVDQADGHEVPRGRLQTVDDGDRDAEQRANAFGDALGHFFKVLDAQGLGHAPLGAEQTTTGYTVVWKLGANDYSIWNTDLSGNELSYAHVSGTSAELL